MKSKIFNITILILMLFVTTISLKGSEATHSSGKRVHLINLYESPVLVPALLQGKKVTRIHYNGEDDYSEYGIKFVVHRDRIKLKLESVEYRDFSDDDWRLVTLGIIFTYSPKKGQM